jgi:hypothetical protein
MKYVVEIFFRSNTIAGNKEGLGITVNMESSPEEFESFLFESFARGVIPISRQEEFTLIPTGDIKYVRVRYKMPVEQGLVPDDMDFIVEDQERPISSVSMDDVEYGIKI